MPTTTQPTEDQAPASRGPRIHFPTKEEADATIAKFAAHQKETNAERRAAMQAAVPALDRLCQVMCGRSGQPHHLRALLYSMYNGQPASLLEVVGLDWAIRKDLGAVILAFGFEQPGVAGSNPLSFFYKEMRAAITKAGQWDWFCEAHTDKEEA